MTTRNKPKAEDLQRIREQAFREGYEAGLRAARKKNSVPEDPPPEAALEYARKAYRLSGVHSVYARVGDIIEIRTVPRDGAREGLDNHISGIELQIYDAFPDLDIDFYLMGAQSRPEFSLESSGFQHISREALVASG